MAASDVAGLVAEAAQRFGVPEAWIWSVMRIESALNPRAVSTAGAIGLMQIRPETYAELRARYGLGPDPFRPRDNILAGTAYLREMYDRFGAPGFLAAYNAGPARYEQHLIDGRGLPGETRAYLAKLAPVLGADASKFATPNEPPPAQVMRPSIFVPLAGEEADPFQAHPSPLDGQDPAAAAIFVALTPSREAR